ncbi:unnamed protein product, partial [Ectocarpus fasciculatus]
MGRNNRRKNKWRGDGATETGLPHRRRWGRGYGRGTPEEDDIDDPELDIRPAIGRSKGIKGSGKLRARHKDTSDSTGGTPFSNASRLTDEGGQTRESLRTEGGREHQANDEKHDFESATKQESLTKTSHKNNQQKSSTTRHAAAGVEQGSSTGGVPALALTAVDPQRPRQLQLKSPEEVVCQGRTTGVEDEGGIASSNEDTPAVVNNGDTLVDNSTSQLPTSTARKECDGTVSGSLSDETTATVPSDASPCNAEARRTTSAGWGVVVPALRLGNEHSEGGAHEQGVHHPAGTAKVVTDDTPYSLTWADGRTGRQLMASVEGLLQEWLCAQEAEGTCVREQMSAIGAVKSSSFAPLGQLQEKLYMPNHVACALGLRFRGGEWEKLTRTIAAARDFLDLEAEAACSNALATFGSQTSAPRPTDKIPVGALAVLARTEAAGLDLVALEVRQALRAEASRVAPRSCPSAASALFQELDPDAKGMISATDLARVACRLLGLSPERAAEHSPRATSMSSQTTSACTTARSARRSTTSSIGAAGPRSTTSGDIATLSSFSSGRSRIRQVSSVIYRFARTATVAASSPAQESEKKGTRGSGRHEQPLWACQSHSGRRQTGRGSEQAAALVAPPVVNSCYSGGALTTRRLDDAREDIGETRITRSVFCRFVEGKKFDGQESLEGFLRTLSRAGRSEVPVAAGGGATAHSEPPPHAHDRAYSSDLTERRQKMRVEGGAWETVGSARWGARGLRRASTQFTHSTSPPNHADLIPSMAKTSVGRRATVLAQAHGGVAVHKGFLGVAGTVETHRSAEVGTSARSTGGGLHLPSSRSRNSTIKSNVASSGGEPKTPTGDRSGPRGGGFVARALSSFDSNGSGTLSSEEFVSAASKAAGLDMQIGQEWGDVLATKFAAATNRGEAAGGVRWLGGSGDGTDTHRLDIAALADFLRPKHFSLSVMTPFGLVELSLEDQFLTLGDLREVIVSKMFWRQHNCQVRRSDRDNFTLSRYYGTLPLDTESAGQRRRLVLDVLRPGELLFVTDRAAHHTRQDTQRSVPRFKYMMGMQKQQAGRVATPAMVEHTSCKGMSIATKPPPCGAVPKRRWSSGNTATTAGATGASAPPRRSSCIPASSSPAKRHNDSNAAAAGSIPERTTTSVPRASTTRLSQTATRNGTDPPSRDRAYARRRTGGRGSTSSNGGDSWVARGELAGKSHDGRADEKRGRKTASFHEPPTAHGPSPTKGRRKTAVEASFVFDWSAAQVERWIGETMELECYREAFQAKKAGWGCLLAYGRGEFFR